MFTHTGFLALRFSWATSTTTRTRTRTTTTTTHHNNSTPRHQHHYHHQQESDKTTPPNRIRFKSTVIHGSLSVTTINPTNTAVVCFDTAVVCFDTAVVCFDTAVVCFDTAVVCFDTAVVCFDTAVVCFDTAVVCFDTAVVCLCARIALCCNHKTTVPLPRAVNATTTHKRHLSYIPGVYGCWCSHINSHNQIRGHRTGSSHSGVEECGSIPQGKTQANQKWYTHISYIYS